MGTVLGLVYSALFIYNLHLVQGLGKDCQQQVIFIFKLIIFHFEYFRFGVEMLIGLLVSTLANLAGTLLRQMIIIPMWL